MGTEAEPVAESAPARASTASVLVPVAVVALVAVTVVMMFARVSAGAKADPEGATLEGEVPTTLAGDIEPGPVPDPIRNAMDLPVIGAAQLDEPPEPIFDECSASTGEIEWDEGDPAVESALATTDVLLVSLIGKGEFGEGMGFDGGQGKAPDRFRMVCTARHDGGSWFNESSNFEPVFDEGGDFGHTGSGYSCCDDNGLATATGNVDIVDGATWALQDRGGWYQAYPLQGRDSLTVTWKFREQRMGPGTPPQSAITFLDDEGEVLGEAFAGGQF